MGRKAQRPSPMEILIVLEKQQIRLELIHKGLCDQIEKTTDYHIREVGEQKCFLLFTPIFVKFLK